MAIWHKRQSKIKKKKYQDIHAKIYNDKNNKPQQKHRFGTVSKSLSRGGGGVGSGGGGGGVGGLNPFYEAITLALSSAVVYTRHLFSPREGF